MSIKARMKYHVGSTRICPVSHKRFTPTQSNQIYYSEVERLQAVNARKRAKFHNNPSYRARNLARSKAYYQGNSTKIIADVKTYQKQHPDKKKEWNDKWIAKNQERVREISREYHNGHKEEINAKRRQMRKLGLWK